MLSTVEKYYVATIGAAKYLGSVRVQQLINFFGDAQSVWTAKSGEIEKAGLPQKALESFLDFRANNPDAPAKLIEYCDKKNIGLCSIYDEDYPPMLMEIQNPPTVFYYYGTLEPFAERIAMVGTRNNTDYGQRVAMEIAEELAAAGITIVSGAARGIDTFSHMGAMKRGRTVAVLGCGIEYAFKVPNHKLIREIAEKGVVMTDFKPSQPPTKETFPPRNRIIAGLSRGVIVIEAGERSGADITCGYAGDFGRDVFAVPGSIYWKKSVGCNRLIRDSGGGTVVRSAADILEFYNWTQNKSIEKNIFDEQNISDTKQINNETLKLEGVEKKIFDVIPSSDFITIDEILDTVEEVSPDEIPSILLQLEMKNCIVEKDGTYSKG